jgi:hypothetical protein
MMVVILGRSVYNKISKNNINWNILLYISAMSKYLVFRMQNELLKRLKKIDTV